MRFSTRAQCVIAMRRIAIVLVCPAVLAACATKPVYERHEPPPPPTEQALVYVFRPYATFASLRDVTLVLGELPVAELSSKRYTWLYVPPGDYILKQQWPRGMTSMKSVQIDVNLE